MHRCLLPQSEQAELRAGVSLAQAARDKTRALLVQIFETAAPDAPQVELELFENYLDYFEADIVSLISAQNIALKAGLTAEGE